MEMLKALKVWCYKRAQMAYPDREAYNSMIAEWTIWVDRTFSGGWEELQIYT